MRLQVGRILIEYLGCPKISLVLLTFLLTLAFDNRNHRNLGEFLRCEIFSYHVTLGSVRGKDNNFIHLHFTRSDKFLYYLDLKMNTYYHVSSY